VRQLIISVMAVNITASSYVVLLPIYAWDIFAGDAQTLGWLWGAAGLGSLVSSLLLASFATAERLPRLILGALLLSGMGLGLLGLVEHFAPALLAMVALGLGITVANVGTNILIQSSAPDHLRGRVVSLLHGHPLRLRCARRAGGRPGRGPVGRATGGGARSRPAEQ